MSLATGCLQPGAHLRHSPNTSGKKENFMKILATIARYLLALIFIVFGLNGFLHFIPQPLPPSEMAKDYFTVMFTSHYLLFVFALQLIAGVLFIFPRTVPLALTIIGPVIVNILLFHALMDPGGIVPGLVVTTLWFVVYWQFRAAFYGIFFTETPSDGSR
jgi:putative oxidoreductase